MPIYTTDYTRPTITFNNLNKPNRINEIGVSCNGNKRSCATKDSCATVVASSVMDLKNTLFN